MAAVLALDDATVEEICATVQKETGEVVVPANYNCPDQLVISGSLKGIEIACKRMKEAARNVRWCCLLEEPFIRR